MPANSAPSANSLGRDFWLLWGSSTASNLGDGVRKAALPLLLVATVTKDPLAVGLLEAFVLLPWVIFSLVGGVAADRYDRNKLILWGQGTRAVIMVGFASLVATGNSSLALIYGVAVIVGIGEVFVDTSVPPAVPQVAGNNLERANSWLSSSSYVAESLVSGPLGAVLVAAALALPFFFDASTFVVATALAFLIRTPLQTGPPAGGDKSKRRQARPGVFKEIADGFRVLKQQRVVLGLSLATMTANIADGATKALLVLMVTDLLGQSQIWFGIMLAIGALGGTAGAFASPRLIAYYGRRPPLVGAVGLLAASILVIGTSLWIGQLLIGFFLGMVAVGGFTVNSQAIRQRLIPDEMLGRVMAISRLAALGGAFIGIVAGSIVASVIHLRVAIIGASLVALGALAIIVIFTADADELDFDAASGR